MKFLALILALVLLNSNEPTVVAEVDLAVPNSLVDGLQELQFSLNRQLLENSEQVEALSTELQQLKSAVDHLVWLSERMDRSVQAVAADSGLLARNVSVLTYQNEQIVQNQQYCANHEALKNLFFELKPKCAPSDGDEFPQLVPDGRQYQSCREAPKRSGVYRFNLPNSAATPASSGFTPTTAVPTTTSSPWFNRPNAPFSAYCEQQKLGGGWMVFQKRQDGSVPFNRTWDEYRDGFGNPRGEYWLGVEKLYQLTASRSCELLIHMEDFDDNSAYQLYQNFRVLNEQDGYKLLLGNSNGTAGNALSIYSNEVFVTYDTQKSYSSCARDFGSGFWHWGCSTGDNRYQAEH
ncbi:angiopoietin-related protein 6-like [Sabethes cyaneus]|uniref:angiopoietin-related protein 6-like n=1 Tax=Sabethes cyaneus TaxID=53552 RepID=UPI00237E01EF|nr:angiopoietin-related protein 6-like [Sabethes cyaneus]